jgi:membrane protease YdiL (CAAX protease family)
LPNSLVRSLYAFFLHPLRDCEAERRRWERSGCRKRVAIEAASVLIVAAVLMTVQYYGVYRGGCGAWLMQTMDLGGPFWQRVAWAVGQVLVYVPVPLVMIGLYPQRRLEDYGVKLRAPFAYWWVYLLMYLAILPAVLAASQLDDFQRTYPFYRTAPGESFWPKMIAWEIVYAAQFVALEFFFRGILLHGTRRRLGSYAILVMTVPYCMIHFGKPVQETLGAIVAGVVLGFMSLKSRSIWMGAALHIAVAWTMDAAALWQSG